MREKTYQELQQNTGERDPLQHHGRRHSQEKILQSKDKVKDGVYLTDYTVPRGNTNLLANSITARLRRSIPSEDVEKVRHQTVRDIVRLKILEKQLHSELNQHNSMMKSEEQMLRRRHENLKLRHKNLNRRNYDRMRGRQRGSLYGNDDDDGLPDIDHGFMTSPSNYLNSSSDTITTDDSILSERKQLSKRKHKPPKIELGTLNEEDFEDLKDIQEDTKLGRKHRGRRRRKEKRIQGETTKEPTNSETTAPQRKEGDKIDSKPKDDQSSSKDSETKTSSEVSKSPEHPLEVEAETKPKKPKEPKVPYGYFAINPIANRMKSSIHLGTPNDDVIHGISWSLGTQGDTNSSGNVNSFSGTPSKDLHPISTGLNREGTSIEKRRYHIVKTGERPVAKVWRRIDIDTSKTIPSTWAKEDTKLSFITKESTYLSDKMLHWKHNNYTV